VLDCPHGRVGTRALSPVADRPAAPAKTRPAALLVTLCWTTFLVSSAGTAIAPFLLDMARDLDAELAAVGNLVALLSIAWGCMSLTAGTASDRVGRRPILLGGVLTLGAARVGTDRNWSLDTDLQPGP